MKKVVLIASLALLVSTLVSVGLYLVAARDVETLNASVARLSSDVREVVKNQNLLSTATESLMQKQNALDKSASSREMIFAGVAQW